MCLTRVEWSYIYTYSCVFVLVVGVVAAFLDSGILVDYGDQGNLTGKYGPLNVGESCDAGSLVVLFTQHGDIFSHSYREGFRFDSWVNWVVSC